MGVLSRAHLLTCRARSRMVPGFLFRVQAGRMADLFVDLICLFL